MKTKITLRQRLLASVLTLVMVFGMMPAMTLEAEASGGLVDNGEGDGYLTDSYGLMAYKYTGNNFDIHGKFDGDWKQVTYQDSGFATFLKVGASTSNIRVNAVSSANGGHTVGSAGLNIAIDLIIQNEGQIIEVKYTVKNNNASDLTFSLGSGEDIQIGASDSAPITSFDGNTGFKMVSTDAADKNDADEYAQFNTFLKDAPGVDDVSGYWYGVWSTYSANVFTDLSPKDPLTNTDSGATWHWADKTIPADATQSYSIKLGIGGKGSENAVRSGVDYAKEQLSELDPNAVYKITVDGITHELTADANGQIPLTTDEYTFIGKTITIVKKGTGGAADSEASEVEIGARPPAPSLDQTGGVIQDATTDLEYSLDGGNTWSSIDAAGALDEIYEQSETVLLRVKATNEAPAGPAQNFDFFADSLPQWAKDAGLNESNAMWNEAEQKLVLKDNVTLTDTLEVPDGSNVTIKVHENETLTAPTGKPAITTNSDLNIGGDGTIKGGDADADGNGSPAISSTGGSVTIDEDSTVEGGDATTGNGGSAIEVTGNTTTITNNGTATGGASDSGTGGSGITSTENITVNGTGNITGGASNGGTGGNGITSEKNITVAGSVSITGGNATSGAGGNGITSGGNVNTGDGDVSGGAGTTDGGDGINTTGNNSNVNTGTGSINGGSGGTGDGGDGISSTGDVSVGGNVTGGDSTAGTGGNGIAVSKDKDVIVGDDSEIIGGNNSGGEEGGGIVIDEDAYNIDYINEKITVKDGYAAKIKGSSDAFSSTVTFEPNTTYEIKKSDGTIVEFTTTARANSPTVTQKQETVQGKKDGTLVGATAKMEYSIDEGATWKNVTDTPLTGFSGETVSVRIKATHDTPCSETVKFAFTESTTTLKVSFNANGGSATSTQENIAYNSEITVTLPTRDGFIFDGWYIDKEFTKFWGHDKGNVLDNYTLQAKWTYEVSGKVVDKDGRTPVANATVTINGKTATTDVNGNYSISGVPKGIYTVTITKDGKTQTSSIMVNGNASVISNISFITGGNKSTSIDVDAGIPPITAGNLENMFDGTEQDTDNVEIELKVTKNDNPKDKEKIDFAIIGQNVLGMYLDIELLKTINDGAAQSIQPPSGEKVTITIQLPIEHRNKAPYQIIHVHNGVTEIITPIYNEDLHTLTFEASKFSTYAYTYTDASISTTTDNVQTGIPQTGDNSGLPIFIGLMLASILGMGVIFMFRKRV